MHPGLRDYLIKDSAHWDSEVKQKILRLLKFEPEVLLQNVIDNIENWITDFALSSHETIIIHDHHTEARDLLEEYKKHFAKELAAIT